MQRQASSMGITNECTRHSAPTPAQNPVSAAENPTSETGTTPVLNELSTVEPALLKVDDAVDVHGSSIDEQMVPPNVKFEIDDIESSWAGVKKYDYIFVRHMLVAIADWPKLVRNVFKYLNPGGWAEFQDLNSEYYSDDGTYTEEHATRKWNKQFVDACESMGRTGRPGLKLEEWDKGAGFQNVKHSKFNFPVGPWAKDPHHREVGMLNLIRTLDGLEAFSLKLFCDVLGQTKDEVLVMLAKIRQEIKSNALHAMFDQYVDQPLPMIISLVMEALICR
ncbi:hypothetical protein KNSL1_008984 [Colletotrichum chrysophilum]|nr:hypothetical protein KNSL1_008984 [Colletotrichum chrysophilum]